MTDEPKTKVDAVATLLNNIKRTVDYDIKEARDLPHMYVRNIKWLNISPSSSYGRPDPQAVAAAERIKSAAIISERMRGEEERDRLLHDISEKLEAWRSILSSMAVDAAIELGCTARNLRAEALRAIITKEDS